jgi:signal transduction histidine kinase
MAISALGSRADIDVQGAPRPAVLWAIALAGLVAAAGAVGLALTSDDPGQDPGLHAALLAWAALPYILAGLIAWWRRPDSRLGPLMIAVGFLSFVPILAWANAAVIITVGEAFDALPPVLFLHVFLAFPSGRLERRLERAVVGAGYVAALGLQLVVIGLGGYGPDNLLAVVTEPGAAEMLQRVQNVAIGAVAIGGIGVLAARRCSRGSPLRRSVALLVDFFALALLMIAALSVTAAFEAPVFEGPAFEWIRRATFVVIGAAPVAFLIGLLNARLARSAVGDLLVELRAEPAPADLQDALARALGDPSLTLAYWLPQFDSWADPEGRPVELPTQDSGRATTLIDSGGEHVAALVHDASLHQEQELLDAVSAAAAIALENGRLHSELNARLDELRGSRMRVIEAGQKERQRLERNLHDGAQQRLIALSLELGLLEERLATDPHARARLGQARQEVALSLEELRDVAHGIHPAVVSGHGLAVALESLAAHAPVPVRLTVALEGRLPEQVEVAAYYVVSESLANIGKHAEATSASVDVARANGRVVVEIVDDGVGGADPERGSGLRSLADRVETLAGGLQVWTPRGGGTRVRAEIPCA